MSILMLGLVRVGLVGLNYSVIIGLSFGIQTLCENKMKEAYFVKIK